MAEDTVPFNDPGSASGFPSMKQLKGRLCIMQPTNLEKGLPDQYKPGSFRDRVTADVHVLDGDTITARIDDDDNEMLFDEPLVPPFKLADMYISGAKLINELKSSLPRAGEAGGLVLGVLTKLPPQKAGQKGAWSLRPATADERKVASDYWKNLSVFD